MPPNVVSKTLRGGLYTRVVGQRILFFQEVASTMDEVVRQARLGEVEGTTVVAESQTASRGRMGRKWVSQPGNLYLTVLLYPAMPSACRPSALLAAWRPYEQSAKPPG